MLKEDARYDYVEVQSDPRPVVARMYSRPAGRFSPRRHGTITLPTGRPRILDCAALPMQSYLQERFSHVGSRSHAARLLQAENKRRYDAAAARGNLPRSRSSGEWHPITAAEIAAGLSTLRDDHPRNGRTPPAIESDLLPMRRRRPKIQHHRAKVGKA
jgi:hypothetical protein